MSSSTIGASDLEREEIDCVIHKITCVKMDEKEDLNDVPNETGNKKGEKKDDKEVVWYERSDETEKDTDVPSGPIFDPVTNALVGGIQYIEQTNEFYLVTDHEGTKLKLICDREENHCFERTHKSYELEYIDIATRETKQLTRSIDSQIIEFKYFNLFHRGSEYSNSMAQAIKNFDDQIPDVSDFDTKVDMIVASGVGGIAGNFIDSIASLQFLFLPIIDPKDSKYYCHAVLRYSECPKAPMIPQLVIHIYPAIKYSLKIGFFEVERTLSATTKKRDKISETPFNFEFNGEYASKSFKISFDNQDQTKNVKTLTKNEQKGVLIYKTINELGEFLRKTAAFCEKMEALLEPMSDEKSEELKKDLKATKRAIGGAGNLLAKPEWIYGKVSLSPALAAEWQYESSEDMRELIRHIQISLGATLSGSVTFDIIKLAIECIKRTKRAAKIASTVAAIASGGMGVIPAILVQFLVDHVASWLMKKFEEGVILQLILSGEASGTPLKFDNLKNNLIENFEKRVDTKIQIQIKASLGFKTSISLIIKVEAEVKAHASATAQIIFALGLNFKDKNLGVDVVCSLPPIKIKCGYLISAGYEIWIFSSENKFREKTKEWKFGGLKNDYKKRYELFTLKDQKSR